MLGGIFVARGALRAAPGLLVPGLPQAGLPDGPDPPPLRDPGVVGDEDHPALLDRGGVCAAIGFTIYQQTGRREARARRCPAGRTSWSASPAPGSRCCRSSSARGERRRGRRRASSGIRRPRRARARPRGRQVARRAGRGAGDRRGPRARHPGARRARVRLAAACPTSSSPSPGTNGKTTTAELHRPHPPRGRAAGDGRGQRRDRAELATSTRSRRTRSSSARCRRSSSRTRSRSRPRAPCCSTSQPDHLDRHGTFEAYRAAKLRVFANQGNDDVAVAPVGLGVEDLGGCARRVCFGAAAGAELAERAGQLWWDDEPLMRRRRARACAARTTAATRWRRRRSASPAGSTPTPSATALRTFARRRAPPRGGRDGRRRPLRQRLQGDERRLDARRARELRRTPVHLILGGRGKGQDFAPLRDAGRGGAAPASTSSARTRRRCATSLGGAARDCGDLERARRRRARRRAARARSSCCRPRARASTSSRTSRPAGGASRAGRLTREGRVR